MPTDAEILQRVFPEAKSPADLPAPIRSCCEGYYHLAEIAGVEGGIPAGVLLHVILDYLATASPVAQPDQGEVAIDATERSDWFGQADPAPPAPPLVASPSAAPTFLALKKANPNAGVILDRDGTPICRQYPVAGQIPDLDPGARTPQGATQPVPLSAETEANGQTVTFVHPRNKTLATGLLRSRNGDSVTVRTRNDQVGQDEDLIVPIAACNI